MQRDALEQTNRISQGAVSRFQLVKIPSVLKLLWSYRGLTLADCRPQPDYRLILNQSY